MTLSRAVLRRTLQIGVGFAVPLHYLIVGPFSLAVSQSRPSSFQKIMVDVEHGRFNEAIPALEKLVRDTPNDLKAHNLLGIALSTVGRKEEANSEFKKVLELDPRSFPALKNLAVNEVALGRWQDGQAHFEEALKIAPHDPVLHLGLGEIEFARKRYSNSVEHFRDSGDLYFREPRLTLHFAQACIETGQSEPAVAALLHLAPWADGRAHFEAAVLLARIEKYAAAADQFRIAQDGFPDAYQVGYNLTLAFVRSKNYAAAVQSGEELVGKGYRKAELYNLLSQAYENNGATKEAYEALRVATEIDPRDESNYLDLMALCLAHQNFDLSFEISEIALRQIPGSYRVRLQRGIVHAMKGQYEDSERELRRATELAPNQSLPAAALSLIELQMNKLPEAIALLRGRRKSSPGDYLSAWFLAEALNRQGAPPGSAAAKEAVQALEDSVAANSKVGAPRVLLGKLLARGGEVDRAVDQFEHALKLDPDDMSAAYQLAQAYRKRGDADRAAKLFAKVSKMKAEDREQFTQQNLVKILREGSQ